MKSLRVAIVAFCALFAAGLLAQGQMRPGQWEVTMQMDMPGLPVKMPAQTTTSCVTPEQAKDPGGTVQSGRGRGRGRGNDNCKTSDQKVDGNKITWKMACTGADAMTGDGEMVFSGDAYTGKMNMNMAQGQMTMQLSGKRIGDCTPSSPPAQR